MKCGKCNIGMEKTGEEIIHNKDVEKYECPDCKGILVVEMT
jgi:hypothetical protein